MRSAENPKHGTNHQSQQKRESTADRQQGKNTHRVLAQKVADEEYSVRAVHLGVQVRDLADVVGDHHQQRANDVAVCRVFSRVRPADRLAERRRHRVRGQLEPVVVSAVDIAHQHIYVRGIALLGQVQHLVVGLGLGQQSAKAPERAAADGTAADARPLSWSFNLRS